MPAVRVTRRRRSSLAIGLTPVKPGNYGISSSSPRNVTFAPNVTPGTYVETDSDVAEDGSEPASPSSTLFPPSESPAPVSSRRRAPPGKRRSQGYIPRPPNAFMLFRADFVRQKHVPGSIETNHGSLSKIIGNCWRALPLEEKRIWELRAKKAKAEHRELYPNYRFRPVHNKNKNKVDAAAKRKDKLPVQIPDERRCEEVAQLLLEGKKGDELAAAVRILDQDRERHFASASPAFYAHASMSAPMPFYASRRPSSVPPPSTLYNHIALPSIPFLMPSQQTLSRPETPVNNIARSNRMLLGQRRPSSAFAAFGRWMMPDVFSQAELQRDDEPLPDVDTSLFEQSFFDSSSGFAFPAAHAHPDGQFSSHPSLSVSISPLDNLTSGSLTSASTAASSAFPFGPADASDYAPFDPAYWIPALDPTFPSAPSSAFSGSPASSESSLPLPTAALPEVHAPQPQHPAGFEGQGWDNISADQNVVSGLEDMSITHEDLGIDLQAQIDLDFNLGLDTIDMEHYASGLEHATFFADAAHCGAEAADMYPYHTELGLQDVQQY